jgi:AcrR family transcriptional regulator
MTTPPVRVQSGVGRGGRRSDHTRDALLRAAAALFRERGYEGTKMGDIGAAVGVTGPAVYRHFPSKEKLLVAIIDREFDLAEARLRAIVDADLAPMNALQSCVRVVVDTVLQDRDVVSVLPAHLRHLPPEVASGMAKRHRKVISSWSRILRMVRPELTASEARVVTTAVSSLINAVGLENLRLPADNLRGRVERMAMAALLSA